MISNTIREEYVSRGFALGPKVLDDNEIEELREALDQVIAAENDGTTDTERRPVLIRNLARTENQIIWQIVDIWRVSEAFERLISNPRITSLAAVLSGSEELRLWHDQIQYKVAATGGVNMWHQDSPAWSVLEPKNAQITAWVALDDVDESNGCMSMVPGSHTRGVQTDFLRSLDLYESMPDTLNGLDVERVLRPVKKGHVHFHHPLTWHGSHQNTSTKPRRAIALHYMLPETRYIADGEHVMKPYIKVGDGEQLTGDYFPRVRPV